MKVRFTWDPNKAESNRRKHGLSFPEAARVFADPLRWMSVDRGIDGEEPWLTIGAVDGLKVVVVAHTVSDAEADTEVIRIISARKAERFERRRYEQGNGEV
jgi:uncharacterized DUF497 family protein